MPDSWAVKQLFPTMPIHRLGERPSRLGVFADLDPFKQPRRFRFTPLRFEQDTGERHAHCLVRGLRGKDAAIRLLGRRRVFVFERKRILQLRVRRRRRQPVNERPYFRFGQHAEKLIHDLAIANGVHCGDAFRGELLSQALVFVRVHLREHDLAVLFRDDLFEKRRQRPARPAPRGPEIHDDRHLLRTLHDFRHEGVVGDVDHPLRFRHRYFPTSFCVILCLQTMSREAESSKRNARQASALRFEDSASRLNGNRAHTSFHPLRYSRRSHASASGQFFARIAVASHSSFRPARQATFPSNTVSVSSAAYPK